ncbi:MAG: hypothetical protein IT433_11455 [Phycisphaerales bacterium]|nr:hypothetical protein [Phycisphaerales bacterium]
MHHTRTLSLIAALCAAACLPSFTLAQSTFTYQGSLLEAGSPVTGLYDLRFRLYDVSAGGSEVATALCADDVSVVGGILTVELDFGSDAFNTTDDRFLEIEVRPDGGLPCSNPAGFTTLAPRTRITRAPASIHALFARNSLNAESADNSSSLGGEASTFYRNASNLNAGTVSDTRLSANVPRLNAANTFTGVVTLGNPLNILAGDGSGLLALSAAAISGQLSGSQIADNSITTFHIAPGAIINSDLSDNSISTTKLVNGAVTSLKLAANSVSGGVGGTIVDGSIGNADLQASVINSANLIDGAVGTIDIAAGAITSTLVATDTLTSVNLAAGSVGSSEILDGGVGTNDLAGNSVTTAKIAPDAVANTRLALDPASLDRVSGGVMQSNGARIGINGPPNATHELFIEGKAHTTTGLTTTGEINAADFTYLNPFPRVHTVSPHDMTFRDNGIGTAHRDGTEHEGWPYVYNTSVLASVACSGAVHLPDGAVVESLEVHASDQSNSALRVMLLRRGLGGVSGGTMALVDTTGNISEDIRVFSDFTISSPTIDNADNVYMLTLQFPAGIAEARFFGAVIRYRVPRPLP